MLESAYIKNFMHKTNLGILTDAAPSANSSTSREVADLIDECNAKNVVVSVYHPKLFPNDNYTEAFSRTTCRGLFYKNKRLALRFISEVSMSTSLTASILFKAGNAEKIDLLLWISPSIFNLLPAFILKKRNGAKIYLMLRDMFPYWAANIGIISRKGVVFKLLKTIADAQMSLADRIGVESSRSLEIFKSIYPQHCQKVEILRNWITVKSNTSNRAANVADRIIRIIYAGNIGLAQGVDHFIALLGFLKDKKDIEVHFVGRGNALGKLVAFSEQEKISNFYLHEPIPFAEFDSFLVNFDMGLVFLDFNIHASNIPGKAMSYLMNGLPVLGSINPGNELEIFVHENKLGCLDSSGNVNNFFSKIDCMVTNYRLGKYQSIEIKKKAEMYFSTQTACDQIVNFN